MSKVAKLAEHSNVVVSDLGGNGTLPSKCVCGGKLDFARIIDVTNNVTVLKCRVCGEIVKLD